LPSAVPPCVHLGVVSGNFAVGFSTYYYMPHVGRSGSVKPAFDINIKLGNCHKVDVSSSSSLLTSKELTSRHGTH
jgi:hypothetical protein